VAFNDEMMLGAMAAMRGAGVDPSKKVTLSFDAIPEAVNLIKAGDLGATVDPGFGQQTGQALRILVDHIRNKTTPPEKVILLKSKLITKETLPNR
jgi:ABC-type sugar transport system substrate-binding protein